MASIPINLKYRTNNSQITHFSQVGELDGGGRTEKGAYLLERKTHYDLIIVKEKSFPSDFNVTSLTSLTVTILNDGYGVEVSQVA